MSAGGCRGDQSVAAGTSGRAAFPAVRPLSSASWLLRQGACCGGFATPGGMRDLSSPTRDGT